MERLNNQPLWIHELIIGTLKAFKENKYGDYDENGAELIEATIVRLLLNATLEDRELYLKQTAENTFWPKDK